MKDILMRQLIVTFFVAACIVVTGLVFGIFGGCNSAGPRKNINGPYVSYLRYDVLPYLGEEFRGLRRSKGEEFFQEGMRYYQRGDFEGAIRNLNLAVRHASDRAQWWLYLGVSHYVRHEATQAISALEIAEFLSRSQTDLQPDAKWYLAQSYLLANRPQDAAAQLEWISVNRQAHAADSETLLGQIQRVSSLQSGADR
jgi:tetratricopeptide (TPR) repeat protein